MIGDLLIISLAFAAGYGLGLNKGQSGAPLNKVEDNVNRMVRTALERFKQLT